MRIFGCRRSRYATRAGIDAAGEAWSGYRGSGPSICHSNLVGFPFAPYNTVNMRCDKVVSNSGGGKDGSRRHAGNDLHLCSCSPHFRAEKLPELGKTLGKAMTEFRRASTELKSTFDREMSNLERETESTRRELAP
jgi:mttA/Hcf106 family